jgi:hypothetical protein
MKKFFTAAIMAATAFSPILSTAAVAAVINIAPPTAEGPNAITMAAMQNQCTTLAAGYSSGPGDVYSGDVADGGSSALIAGPTEAGGVGDRNIDLSTRVGAGTFTPAGVSIVGNPYRNGGSVNMFGVQQATGGSYSASMYDFTANFNSTFAYSFSCDISIQVFHPAVHHDAVPAVGHYINCDFGNGQGNDNGGACDEVAQPQGSCAAHNMQGSSFPGYGMDTEQCKFVVDVPAQDAYDDPAYLDPAAPFTNVAGTPVNQDQTDELSAHEDFGAGFNISETVILGQVVVCISPTTTTQVKKGVPGTWTLKNGYTGSKCTTDWFNTGATAGVDNLNLQGTFISVPIV